MPSSLTLHDDVREGAATSGQGASTRRTLADLVIDGESLLAAITRAAAGGSGAVDLVSVLVTNWPAGQPADDVGRLLGTTPPELLDGRVPLYVCAECGGLGCGAWTAVIEHAGDRVTWRDIGYQTDYEPFDPDDVLAAVGPFEFDRADYEAVLRRFRDSHP